MRRLVALSVLALVCAAGAQPGSAAPLKGTLKRLVFASAAAGGNLGVAVYLPVGYQAGGRYPVLYFLHGLPASPTAYSLRAQLFASWLDRVRLKAIAVVPQAVRGGDPDPEYLDWGPGRDWETALAVELPAFIDRHFRTIPDAAARALVGISAGGYGAALIGFDHPSEFGLVESWSGYFQPTDPTGTHVLDLSSNAALAQANLHARALAAATGTSLPFFAFYTGNHDWRFESDNVHFDAELTAAGIPHRFDVYPGGHEWPLWTAHANEWLLFALTRLAPVEPAVPSLRLR